MNIPIPPPARSIWQKLLDGDRTIVFPGGLGLEPRQILHYRIVQAQLALLAELHDCDGGKQLAVGPHAKLCGCRHWQLRLDVREAEALGPDQFLVAHYTNGDSRQSSIRDLSFNPSRK